MIFVWIIPIRNQIEVPRMASKLLFRFIQTPESNLETRSIGRKCYRRVPGWTSYHQEADRADPGRLTRSS